MRAWLASLWVLASCAELSDTYGEPDASCFDDRRIQVSITSMPFGDCEPLLDGIDPNPVEIDTGSPCFGAWGEGLEAVRLPGGAVVLGSRVRTALISIEDHLGPHYGEVDAYAKWEIPLTALSATPYEVQVFLQPDDLMTEAAKYKVWSARVGTCYHTISQKVETPQWVSLGVFQLGSQRSVIRLDNLAPSSQSTNARVQMGPIRFILEPMCSGDRRGVVTTPGQRCGDGGCAEVVRRADSVVLRVRRDLARPFSVTVRSALSDINLTPRLADTEAWCVDATDDVVELPLPIEPLMPATRFSIELWEGCDADHTVAAPFSVIAGFFAATCDRSCAGY